MTLLDNKAGATRLGFALLRKFCRRGTLPPVSSGLIEGVS